MKVEVTFDVTEDLLSLIYVYYCELGHFRDIYEVKTNGKPRKSKKKSR